MSNNTESMLSENYLVYASWVVSLIFGIPVNAYCLYHLINVTKLNVYIKVIFVILVINFLTGYAAIFCSLIPIIFFKIQNHLTCTILTTPLAYGGAFLQPMSALTSMTRFYMAWTVSNNKVYQNKAIMIAIISTVMLFYSLPIITEIFYEKSMVLACMNRQDLVNYHNPVTVIIAAIMVFSTFFGIAADICMVKLLKKLKIASNGSQLIPWMVTGIVPNDKSKNLEEAVPRNSTLFSTTLLCISGFSFAFCDTLAETLLLTTIVNIFIMPFIIKFTVSSNLKNKIEVPNGLQFHDNQDPIIEDQGFHFLR